MCADYASAILEELYREFPARCLNSAYRLQDTYGMEAAEFLSAAECGLVSLPVYYQMFKTKAAVENDGEVTCYPISALETTYCNSLVPTTAPRIYDWPILDTFNALLSSLTFPTRVDYKCTYAWILP